MKSQENGNVNFKLGQEVVAIKERSNKGVRVAYKAANNQIEEEWFDELILAVGA